MYYPPVLQSSPVNPLGHPDGVPVGIIEGMSTDELVDTEEKTTVEGRTTEVDKITGVEVRATDENDGEIVEVVSGVDTSHSSLSASIKISLVLVNLLPSAS